MLNFFKDFFIEHQPTNEDAQRKAEQVGFTVTESDQGHIVHGIDAYGEEHDWTFAPGEEQGMHSLLDHANSVKIGDEYRQQRFGLKPGEEDTSDQWCEHKHEIRDHRMKYYDEEYKPGWRRLFGL